MEDTGSMYEKISALLLPKTIRESGGFYDVAKNLSKEEKSKMTFSIIPLENKSLMQLKLSMDYPNMASSINQVDPLEFLKADELKRSKYFSNGFYPLNSILQVAVLSPESIKISDIKGNIVESQIVEGEKVPKEVTKNVALVFVKRIMWDVDNLEDLEFLLQQNEKPEIAKKIKNILEQN